jgi:hypothetical protein
MGPKQNEAVSAVGRKVTWRSFIQSATFCSSCGRGAPTIVTWEAPGKLVVTINSCYAHAHQKIGDHDALGVKDDAAVATAGQLDIDDCSSTHVTGTLWATFGDGHRVDAIIDTEIKEPSGAAGTHATADPK